MASALVRPINPKARPQGAKSSLDLAEHAASLLRTASAATLATYYIGTLPFVLGGLYYWTDMGRGAYAGERLMAGALAMSALFVWMKTWQAIFCSRLRAALHGVAPPPLGLRRFGHTAIGQAALQPPGLFLLPLSALPILPFPWVVAFFQNVIVLGDHPGRRTRELMKESARHAALWPAQNQTLLLMMLGFGVVVFLNLLMVCMGLPYLLNKLLGIESVFTRGINGVMNTTLLISVVGLTYLCLDPLFKAAYTLRCFYGDSTGSGEDLRAELRSFSRLSTKLAAWLVAGMLLAGAGPVATAAEAEEQSPGAPAEQSNANIPPPKLDEAIQETLRGRKYAWRQPRVKAAEPESEYKEGAISKFFRKVFDFLGNCAKAVGEWLGGIMRWIFGRSSPRPVNVPSTMNWLGWFKAILYGLVAAVIVVIIGLIYRLWQGRRRGEEPLQAESIQVQPDLRDESVSADQLPEDGWIKLAKELLERGEFRLALRAFYLASLAHLATRNLVSLAKSKSNRDYERELKRRAHAYPELVTVFGENVTDFDRVWYGMHEVNPELLGHFAANVERIKAEA